MAIHVVDRVVDFKGRLASQIARAFGVQKAALGLGHVFEGFKVTEVNLYGSSHLGA